MNHTNFSGKPMQDEKGFLKIDISESWPSHREEDFWYFNEGNVRKVVKSIYNKEDNYTFLSVVANSRAVNELPKYVKFNKDKPEFSYTIRKRQKSDDEDNSMFFSPDLMNTYLHTLGKLLDSHLGDKSHISFPIVNGRTHGISESIYWPVVYILRDNGNSSKQFRDLVGKLNDNDSYKIIKEVEGIWKYRLGHAEVLRDNKILPLVVQPHEWKIDSENLKNAINFLVPFNLSERHNEGHEDY